MAHRVSRMGWEGHGVDRDGPQAAGGSSFRLGNNPPRLAEQPWQDPEAHWSLMGEAICRLSARQMTPDGPQRIDLILISPQLFERLLIGLKRGAESVNRQREYKFGVGEPVARTNGGVREDRGRIRAAVYQRHPLAFLEIEIPDRLDDVQHRQHLARTSLTAERQCGHRAGEHRGYALGHLRADLPMTFHEASQPGKDDPADHLLVVPSHAEALPGMLQE